MKKLNDWFEDLNKLIQDSFISYKHLSVIKELKSETKFLNEDFFDFYQYQQWFMINIQLAKIFECKPKTQKRNIITLFNNIINGEYADELAEFFADNKQNKSLLTYEQFIEEIKNLNSSIKTHRKVIDKVINARNKIYAHTDIERIIDFPSLEELKSLIDLASKLYNNSRGQLYGISTNFTRGIINLTINDVIRIMNIGLKKNGL